MNSPPSFTTQSRRGAFASPFSRPGSVFNLSRLPSSIDSATIASVRERLGVGRDARKTRRDIPRR